MANELIESRETMSFHLDGSSEIDAVLLSKMISDMAELTKLAAHEVDPDAYLKMNVTAFRNGSFQIDFSAVCQAVETIFTTFAPGVGVAATVIGAVKGIFEIKKLLKGEEAKSVKNTDGEQITIEAKDGNTVTVLKQSQIVMNSIHVDQLVTNIASTAREHNPIGGFSIKVQDSEVACTSDDVRNISKTLPIIETANCQRTRIDARMPIRKAVFEGTAKWGFDLNGRAIEASIEDENFMREFHENGSVNRGDYIDATVEIYVDLDENGLPIKGTEKYTVIKVDGGIQRGESYRQEPLA